MKKTLETLISKALTTLQANGILDNTLNPTIHVERTRDSSHGDFATNIALVLAKSAKTNPRQLAQQLIEAMPANDIVSKIELAGAGFINFFIDANAQYQIISTIHQQGNQFGLSQIGSGKKVQVEFVSANPTGPLHVGHGRGAAYGSAVANLLVATGFDVHKEYYVNDAGRQMDILATSVWLRYLEACGETLVFPCNAYRGAYVRDLAQNLVSNQGKNFVHLHDIVFANLPLDETDGGDKEIYIDSLIARAKQLLGAEGYRTVFDVGLTAILEDIKEDLAEFGVTYHQWFSERSLMDDGSIENALAVLRENNHLYEKDGAIWFKSSELGDEKDRVVIRDNGHYTYFASDIAYHWNKLERGFDVLIDIWGADHHGYIARVKAALTALGADENKLHVLLVQFATLWRGEEKVQMSTRSGDFVTLRELRSEVGRDAARFFYVMRRSEQHMDFDLELATSKSNENPVFYVQYAHARVCSVFRQLPEKGYIHNVELGMANLPELSAEHESVLLTTLARYPEVIERAATQYEPHLLINYLRELATDFHTYYNAHQFLVESATLRNARLNLISSVQQVLVNGLILLGISAPEAM
ncbi:MAG: arginine--tRNA ligase [Methylococcales bacterium]|jgi:arginyl-tRNA synthetase|nr:arginine--tRNA ligase [Methylococcales bacterium]MCX7076710.1 arginine--tRNA ligase [Methylococcales bacterium]